MYFPPIGSMARVEKRPSRVEARGRRVRNTGVGKGTPSAHFKRQAGRFESFLDLGRNTSTGAGSDASEPGVSRSQIRAEPHAPAERTDTSPGESRTVSMSGRSRYRRSSACSPSGMRDSRPPCRAGRRAHGRGAEETRTSFEKAGPNPADRVNDASQTSRRGAGPAAGDMRRRPSRRPGMRNPSRFLYAGRMCRKGGGAAQEAAGGETVSE